MKIFENYNFETKGNIVPLSDFHPLGKSGAPNFNKNKVKSALVKAEGLLTAPIPTLSLSQYRSYHEKGSTVAYGTPYCERMDMAFQLLIAELCEGNGRYTDKIADVVWAMLEEATWVLPEHTPHLPDETTKRTKVPAVVGNKYPHGLELGACYRAALIALIYYYMKDSFDAISPFINEKIVYELKDRIINPFIEHTFYWSGVLGNKVNNWCPWIVSNVLLTTALAEEDDSKRERVVEISMQYLDNFINSYKSDGGCEEGPTYWAAAAACLFDALEIIEELSLGKISIYHEPLIKAMGEYEPRMHITDKYFVNFADSRSTGHIDGDMLRRYGQKCGSEIIESFGDTMLKLSEASFGYKMPYRALKNLTTPSRDLATHSQKAATDTYFPDLKVMVLRESENPDTGLFFAMKGGHNNEMHNHNDVGSFIVYNNGKPVLIDAGVGEYTKQTFSAQRYEIWSMQSLYHNLPAIGGVGQHQGERFASKCEVYDEKARSLTMDISDAWEKECGIISLVRTGSLNGGVVTVCDDIKLENEADIDFVFITHIEPKLAGDGKIALNMGCVLNYDPSLKAEIEEFEPTGMKSIGSWGTDYLYRIHLRTRARECKYTFTVTA